MAAKLEQVFGKVLREVRTKQGLTQEALAELAKVDRTYISLLERGLRQPTLGTLFALAKALDMSLIEIISKVQIDFDGKS